MPIAIDSVLAGSPTARSASADLVSALLKLLDEAELTLELDPSRARRCVAHAQEILTGCALRRVEAAQPTERPLTAWQRRRVLDHVDAHLDGALSADAMARSAGLSVSHFTRAFRATFGTTPYAYVLQKRMERAKRMLSQGVESFSQVALACGFSDQAHFCKLFKRMNGVTPTAWLRLQADAA
ncbi:AraC family transcriptional regulator [Rhizobium sp. FKL33]|uniref:helix-turn-helix domain-containing protein n=1 Tax=Rhizobium sp. FKL33 TaxID=2562307 RepID=UPI0010C06D2C|nr:AraC family transcriptional regulator [Rhizobium sp. FKL33]